MDFQKFNFIYQDFWHAVKIPQALLKARFKTNQAWCNTVLCPVPLMLWWREENISQCHVFLHKKRHRKQMLHLWNEALNSPVYWCGMYFMLCAHHSPCVCAVISKRCDNTFCFCLEEQKSGSHSTLLQRALKSLTVGRRHFYSESGVSVPSFFIITCVYNRSPGKVLGPPIPSIIHIMRNQSCPVTERSGFSIITVAIILP